jgi:phosphotransferase system enzyme I (PtsI)
MSQQGTPAEVDQEGTQVPPSPAGGAVLRGTPVAPGLVFGTAHRKDHELQSASTSRVPRDEVDRELNRFRHALDASRRQLTDLRARLEGRVDPDDARILDTHLAYLRDSAFIADVENLILGEQIRLEGAIAKVIADFDRIFRLVENETLRQSAIDLRDVAIRVLRNIEQTSEDAPDTSPPERYVLIARELSIVDMFDPTNEHVLGIVTQEGGLTSHAAVFARSMRIPTVTAVNGLLDKVCEGDYLILDATEGVVRIDPDEVVRGQYAEARDRGEVRELEEKEPSTGLGPVRTHDGAEVRLTAACGNLPEVQRASALGVNDIGPYRTELLYLLDREAPSRDALVRHYRSVYEHAAGGEVTFRLLCVDSGLELPYLHSERERNPALGRAGVRLLLDRPALLRRQLRSLLLAGGERPVRLLVPFVTDVGELRRVREVLFEEKLELRRDGESFQEEVLLGCVLETPASVLGVRDLAREAELLSVNLDALIQHLLATDREGQDGAHRFERLHPVVARALSGVAEAAAGHGRELVVFGACAVAEEVLPMLLGLGVRALAAPPSALGDIAERVRRCDARVAARAARALQRHACPEDAGGSVSGFRHGFAR